ncbi:tetratricopeptide repeat protein [Candidatus Nitrotoga sp. M5]|uniref:tetratricopeptide repeat protein n=1 Tax=Candidatus Nitrotoga sp. M5 TaxID=2890409 RepID=UPI001EF23058|nr:tetratricopeptide repeat protein [Candidatus Nitrotoga sp. M5]CAH1386293.1 TPR_REGION domain-containing protein [Candidatus Nitrotoga sp. M5]
MRFQYFYSVITAGVSLALLSSLAAAKTPEQIFEQVSPSVVVVDIFDAKNKVIGQGSGVVISTGQVITNCHVVKRGKSQRVRQSGSKFSATLQYSDPSRDLCQLNVPDLQAPPAVLGTAKKLKVGQRVYAIGAPEDLELTLSEGLISSLRPHDGAEYIQTSAAISLGSSGGGLFNDQGQLIGITTFYHADGQNLNFALPVDWIGELPKRAQGVPEAGKKNGLAWLNRVVALEDKQNWSGMLKLSQKWVKSEPESADAWFSLGIAHKNLQQYEKAIKAYRRALRIQPEYADAWNNLGNIHNNIKQHSQAIQAYQEALRIDPEHASAWNNLGIAHGNLKQYKQAISAFREAIRIEPENASVWYNLGEAYFRNGQQDKVLETYQTLRKLDFKIANVYSNAFILP